ETCHRRKFFQQILPVIHSVTKRFVEFSHERRVKRLIGRPNSENEWLSGKTDPLSCQIIDKRILFFQAKGAVADQYERILICKIPESGVDLPVSRSQYARQQV